METQNIPNKEELEKVVKEIIHRINFECETSEEEIDLLACQESYYVTISQMIQDDFYFADIKEKYKSVLKQSNSSKYLEKRLTEEFKKLIHLA